MNKDEVGDKLPQASPRKSYSHFTSLLLMPNVSPVVTKVEATNAINGFKTAGVPSALGLILALVLVAASVHGVAAPSFGSCTNIQLLPKEQAPALKCLHLGECQKSQLVPFLHSPFK